MALPTLAQKLVEAEIALHNLLTGTLTRVLVDQNGERIEYTATNTGKLRQYIEQLKNEISGTTVGSNGPLRVVF